MCLCVLWSLGWLPLQDGGLQHFIAVQYVLWSPHARAAAMVVPTILAIWGLCWQIYKQYDI